MTLDAFFDLLTTAGAGKPWVLLASTTASDTPWRPRYVLRCWLRGSTDPACPISVCQGQPLGAVGRVARALDLSQDDTRTLIAAADDTPLHEGAVRARLLATVGLQEVPR